MSIKAMLHPLYSATRPTIRSSAITSYCARDFPSSTVVVVVRSCIPHGLIQRVSPKAWRQQVRKVRHDLGNKKRDGGRQDDG